MPAGTNTHQEPKPARSRTVYTTTPLSPDLSTHRHSPHCRAHLLQQPAQPHAEQQQHPARASMRPHAYLSLYLAGIFTRLKMRRQCGKALWEARSIRRTRPQPHPNNCFPSKHHPHPRLVNKKTCSPLLLLLLLLPPSIHNLAESTADLHSEPAFRVVTAPHASYIHTTGVGNSGNSGIPVRLASQKKVQLVF